MRPDASLQPQVWGRMDVSQAPGEADDDDDGRRDDDDVTLCTFLFAEHNASELPWEHRRPNQ